MRINSAINLSEVQEVLAWRCEDSRVDFKKLGGFRLQVMFGCYPSDSKPGIFFWLYGRNSDSHDYCRLGFHSTDIRSHEIVTGRLESGDEVEVFVHTTTKGYPRYSLGKIYQRAGFPIPPSLLASWSEPKQERAPFGRPILLQRGGEARIMVVQSSVIERFDSGDLTQGYAGVRSFGDYVRRLYDYHEYRLLMEAAEKDGRPTRNPLRAFQAFMGGRPESQSENFEAPTLDDQVGDANGRLAPATVLYSCLDPFPRRPWDDQEEEAQHRATNERLFREILLRFRPDILLVSGNLATRRIANILSPISASPNLLARQREMLSPERCSNPRYEVHGSSLPAKFTDGTTCSVVPVHDLTFFGESSVGPNRIPPYYWQRLRDFLRDEVRRLSPKSEESTYSKSYCR